MKDFTPADTDVLKDFNLTDKQLVNLETYFERIVECNKLYNITAITARDDVYLKHFADSLLALPLIPDGARLLDIGCGAGLPSIPLKIAKPSINALLIDSVGKKIRFVESIIKELNLNYITALHTRIEDLKAKDFDIAVARAVSGLNTLCEYALPFLKSGGRMLAYKSNDIEDELNAAQNAIKTLGGEVENIHSFSLPGTDIVRKIVEIKKVRHSPSIYPRGKNLPRTKPI